jgi:UDP-N-acetylglucosamine acyltransferase
MTIGKNTYIHPTAVIFDNVTIGDDCYIGPFCIIGGPPEHADCDPLKEGKGVMIGNGCRLYGHNTVDSGMDRETCICFNSILMKGAHVGHDSFLFPHVTLSCGAKIGGHSSIGQCSVIGLNATIHQFTYLITGTMVGASAFVKGQWENDWRILAGVPAKDIGENVRGMDKWGVSQ